MDLFSIVFTVEMIHGIAIHSVSGSRKIYVFCSYTKMHIRCFLNCRFAAALASDHRLVLQPDTETAFTDAQDVVRRLLPYHVFLQPRDDMEEMLGRPLSELRGYTAFRSSGKGKRKATEEEWMREEIRGKYCLIL
jgi:hypothetical protein